MARGAAGLASPLSLVQPQGRPPRLLLAEDSVAIRVVTSAMLKSMGCEVEAVEHGEEALNCASVRSFDLIVLDIEMPVMDGITAARSIRNLSGAAGQTPLMALSALLADASLAASWRETFDLALPKPANRNELHAAVGSVLARAVASPFHPHPAQPEIVRMKTGLSASVWEELVKVAARDIRECVRHIDRLSRRNQSSSLAFYAHKLRGLALTFAAPRLAELALQLESANGAVATGAIADAIGGAASLAIAELETSVA